MKQRDVICGDCKKNASFLDSKCRFCGSKNITKTEWYEVEK